MIEHIMIAGLATTYLVFILTGKKGPFDLFAKLRAVAAQRLPKTLAYHISCRTCLSLSAGIIALIALYTPAAPLVYALATAGVALALHGMAGYWHQPDD